MSNDAKYRQPRIRKAGQSETTLKIRGIWSIGIRLQLADKKRDLALVSQAIDFNLWKEE